MLKRMNFFFEFFEKNSVLPFYESLKNNTNGSVIRFEDLDGIKENKKGICVCVVNMIPPYFDLEINSYSGVYRAFRVKFRTGYIIDLSHHSNAKEYLKQHLGTRHTKNILNRLKRLESCFDINYKILLFQIFLISED